MAPELESYVEDGTLRMEWRDFPYLGQESTTAALAARSAQEQGKFWEYRDLLYENQGAGYSEERLITLAQEAGLDVEWFEASLTGGVHEADLDRDFREAQDAGIRGTPAVTVNGQLFYGPQPVETFEQAIEEELQRSGNG